jgi:hypothetical protein
VFHPAGLSAPCLRSVVSRPGCCLAVTEATRKTPPPFADAETRWLRRRGALLPVSACGVHARLWAWRLRTLLTPGPTTFPHRSIRAGAAFGSRRDSAPFPLIRRWDEVSRARSVGMHRRRTGDHACQVHPASHSATAGWGTRQRRRGYSPNGEPAPATAPTCSVDRLTRSCDRRDRISRARCWQSCRGGGPTPASPPTRRQPAPSRDRSK